jgi:hypothetical protein
MHSRCHRYKLSGSRTLYFHQASSMFSTLGSCTKNGRNVASLWTPGGWQRGVAAPGRRSEQAFIAINIHPGSIKLLGIIDYGIRCCMAKRPSINLALCKLVSNAAWSGNIQPILRIGSYMTGAYPPRLTAKGKAWCK